MSTFLQAKHVHLVGIKGVAMTALSQCLADMGMTLTGSDTEETFVTQQILEERKIPISIGFDASDLPDGIDVLVYTGAHQGKNNPQVLEAVRRQVSVLSHAEALGELMTNRRAISVCGTGGKSTTTAMIAWILEYAGKKPSYSIGVGNALNLSRTGRIQNALQQESNFFVAEADEYAVDPTSDHRPRFVYQHPEFIVCTHLAYDHPDIYADFPSLVATFAQFFERSTGPVFVSADSEPLLETYKVLQKEARIHPSSCSVGFHIAADYLLTVLPSQTGENRFRIEYQGEEQRQPFFYGRRSWECKLRVPGDHNIVNAGLAFVCAVNAGMVDPQEAGAALAEFRGTMRRFEPRGRIGMLECFDDYAHTPDEIRATIQALRAWRPEKKILVAFQPHTYSRTKALFDGFVQSLSLADEIVILDIFASARESADTSVSSMMLAERIGTSAQALSSIEDLATYMSNKSHDRELVCISLGAGDIYKVYERLQMEKP